MSRIPDSDENPVAELLPEDRQDGRLWLARLREVRDREGIPACSSALALLAALEVGEEEADRLLARIVEHREHLCAVLGRDPGLRFAAADVLHNLERRILEPAFVELTPSDRGEEAWSDVFARGGDVLRLTAHEIRRARRHGVGFALVRVQTPDGSPIPENGLFEARRTLRESDAVAVGGEDRLVAILPATDRVGARVAADRLRARLVALLRSDAPPPALVAGVAVWPEDGGSPEALLDAAAPRNGAGPGEAV
jgi:hypothetical protein